MMRRALLLACALAAHGACTARAGHEFGVIGHSFTNSRGEKHLEQSLAKTRSHELSFVVATGIKGEQEPCSDALYMRRHELFDEARRPIIVLPAASDWSTCKNAAGRLVNIERLHRLREVFYPEAESLGARKLALTRLSISSKFRSYAENAYWVADKVLYATVNLPSNNNHYRPEAGRNSEYEDRSVANRFWLNRLFALARRTKLDAVVLFSEGDVKALTEPPGLLARLGRGSPTTQDGYAATRTQLLGLAEKYAGKVLLIDSAEAVGAVPEIAWRGNLGHVSVGSGTYHIKVAPNSAKMFELEEP